MPSTSPRSRSCFLCVEDRGAECPPGRCDFIRDDNLGRLVSSDLFSRKVDTLQVRLANAFDLNL
jgi:hypothetical protein